MAGRITELDTNQLRLLALNSPIVNTMMVDVGNEIYREIYRTAPKTYKHAYSYRDHFRVFNTRTSKQQGYRVLVIAERFQWQFIEFGWREWRDEKPHDGHNTMTNALLKQEVK